MSESEHIEINEISEQIKTLSAQILGLQTKIQALTKENKKFGHQIQNTSLGNHEQISDLQVKMQTLASENEQLRNQIQNSSPDKSESLSEEFLLSDFKETSQFWRHTDSRLENAIRLYLTINTIAVSGSVILVNQNPQAKILISFISVISFIIFCSGTFLSIRIIGVLTGKGEYALSLNRIRAYFAEKEPKIQPYLVLPFSDIDIEYGLTNLRNKLKKYTDPLLISIRLWSSLMLSFSLVCFILILFPGIQRIPLALLGFSMFFINILFLRKYELNTIRRGMDRLESFRK